MSGYGLDVGAGAVTQDPLQLLRSAIEAGIGYVDTAAGYDGAEALLGRLTDLLRLRRVRLSTKLTAQDLPHGLGVSQAFEMRSCGHAAFA
jgi:predicted aldo/keto reductase-like oxidoreductase